jgi:hypothetical protein
LVAAACGLFPRYLNLWLFSKLLRFIGFFVFGWPLLRRYRLFFSWAVFCFVGAWFWLFRHYHPCGGASVVVWSVGCLRVETCLTMVSSHFPTFCLTELFFGFWWAERFCFKIGVGVHVQPSGLGWCLLWWSGNWGSVFLSMGLGGGPRLGGVLFGVYFRRFAYIRRLCYVVYFSSVIIHLEQRSY